MVTDANALAQANRPVISTTIFPKVILVKILAYATYFDNDY